MFMTINHPMNMLGTPRIEREREREREREKEREILHGLTQR